MFEKSAYSGNLQKDYDLLNKQLEALSADETDTIALLSNASALLNQFLDEVNWTGFYIYKDDELVLGPFQGLPACIRIPMNKGVCGTAASTRETKRIEDVHTFPGHIACDAATRSEIVIPIIVKDKLFGVLDIDSPITGRFSEDDEAGLTKFVRTLEHCLQA